MSQPCIWCGTALNEGAQICTKCHRSQTKIGHYISHIPVLLAVFGLLVSAGVGVVTYKQYQASAAETIKASQALVIANEAKSQFEVELAQLRDITVLALVAGATTVKPQLAELESQIRTSEQQISVLEGELKSHLADQDRKRRGEKPMSHGDSEAAWATWISNRRSDIKERNAILANKVALRSKLVEIQRKTGALSQ